jgi:hypothetical protein
MKKSSLWYLPGARFFSLIFIWAPDIRYQSKTCFLLHQIKFSYYFGQSFLVLDGYLLNL